MLGSELVELLPCERGPTRERVILDAVKAGRYVPPCWSPLRVSFRGHSGVVLVSSDVVRLGEPGDCFRPSVTAATAQRIADELGCLLPTTLVCDLIYQQATARAGPALQPAHPADRAEQGYESCPGETTRMDDLPAMLRHSREVDRQLAGQVGLACNVGKDWVITNRLLYQPVGTAANYGWFDRGAAHTSASGMRLWQALGLSHNDAHTDYSQTGPRLVYPTMLVDGQSRSVLEVGRDPDLCGLISSEGVVKVWRQPSVPAPGEPAPTPVQPLPVGTEQLQFTSLLRLRQPYQTGEDVRQWQQFLRIRADSVFGPQTDSATRAFQRDHVDPVTGRPLVVDGVVGTASLRAANEVLRQRNANEDEQPQVLIDDFIKAAKFTNVDRSADIKHIVIHTAEIDEVATAAEALSAWVSGTHAPQASWHYCIDPDSTIQNLDDHLIAWHAPGANRTGIGIELAGYARQTAEDWADEYSQAVLERAARLVAHLATKWKLPLRFVDRDGLKAGAAGVTTHNEVSHAFRKSTHTDPGAAFPMQRLLERAAELQRA